MSWTVLVQIVVAGGLGAAIGLERELSSQPAGLRTHMLVALGAALFTVAGAAVLGGDPTRVAAQVVTGIGFLGGGAIVRDGATTRGLTTAASLWVTAAIGLAVGLRAWLAAALTTLIALGVLYLVRQVERTLERGPRTMEVTLTLAPDAAMDEVARRARGILHWGRVARVSHTAHGQTIMISTRPRTRLSLAALGDQLRGLDGVVGVEIIG